MNWKIVVSGWWFIWIRCKISVPNFIENTEAFIVIRSSLFFSCKNCRRLRSIRCHFHHVITKTLPSHHCSSSVYVVLCANTSGSSVTWFSVLGVVTVFICPLFCKESCYRLIEHVHGNKPRFKPFVIGFWPRKPRLAALAFLVGFLVDRVAFGYVFLRAFWLFHVCYHSTRSPYLYTGTFRDRISYDTVWNPLRYKLLDRGFDSRLCHLNFSLT
jgi:hypothetical protein